MQPLFERVSLMILRQGKLLQATAMYLIFRWLINTFASLQIGTFMPCEVLLITLLYLS
jgi:hypothetical protein